jgi:hypothetical protein
MNSVLINYAPVGGSRLDLCHPALSNNHVRNHANLARLFGDCSMLVYSAGLVYGASTNGTVGKRPFQEASFGECERFE